MAKAKAKLVRIKPYMPHRGQTMRTFTILPEGLTFQGPPAGSIRKGWYLVDADLAARLAEYCQNGATADANEIQGIDSPLLFDIADNERQATGVEERYVRRQLGVKKAVEVGTANKPVDATARARAVKRPGARGIKGDALGSEEGAQPTAQGAEEPAEDGSPTLTSPPSVELPGASDGPVAESTSSATARANALRELDEPIAEIGDDGADLNPEPDEVVAKPRPGRKRARTRRAPPPGSPVRQG